MSRTKHLAAHRVTVREFESVMQNSPLDLAYEVVNGEQRYRSVGMTDSGRLLVAIWTLRSGKLRAVTAFPASARYKLGDRLRLVTPAKDKCVL